MLLTSLFQLVSYSQLILHSQFGDGLKPPTDNSVFSPTLGEETVLQSTNNALSFIITAVTGVAAVFFLFQFVLGAFAWVNAGGESKKVEEARDRITQGVIGLILIIGSYAIVGLIGKIIGIDILNPGQFVQDNLLKP